MLNRPTQPDLAAGLAYPFKIKGPEVYIGAADANCVSLSLIFLILSFCCIAYAVGSKSAAPEITSNDAVLRVVEEAIAMFDHEKLPLRVMWAR
jgi:hypothetical protein